jgi:hypothetical protein
VPKTFGIKYGCIVMAFTMLARVFSQLTVIAMPKNHHWLQFTVCIIVSIGAIVLAWNFDEKLDIIPLLKKKKVVFKNFGLRMSGHLDQLDVASLVLPSTAIND